MAAVVGMPGRGKTTAAEKYVSMNVEAVYIRFCEWQSHVAILRETAFELAGARPRTTGQCFELIADELREKKRLIIVDEADRMGLKCINTLRALHDRCGCPILFVGETALRGKLAQERRVSSRVREIIEFGPVTEADLIFFYEKSLFQEISQDQARRLAKHAEGDFRLVVRDAIVVEKFLKTHGLKKLNDSILKEVCQ